MSSLLGLLRGSLGRDSSTRCKETNNRPQVRTLGSSGGSAYQPAALPVPVVQILDRILCRATGRNREQSKKATGALPASRLSSISTNPKPGGDRATQVDTTLPNLRHQRLARGDDERAANANPPLELVLQLGRSSVRTKAAHVHACRVSATCSHDEWLSDSAKTKVSHCALSPGQSHTLNQPVCNSETQPAHWRRAISGRSREQNAQSWDGFQI